MPRDGVASDGAFDRVTLRAGMGLGLERGLAPTDHSGPGARANGKRRGRRAPALWPALRGGRYTVVDRIRCAGELLLIARRSPRHPPPDKRLTPVERRIAGAIAAGALLKVLALELGWTQARVSRTLRTALRKLGLRDSYELVLAAAARRAPELTGTHRASWSREHSTFGIGAPRVEHLTMLTRAEREVVAEVVRGLSDREIAARRKRSVRTVANQVAGVLEKLRIPTRRVLIAELARSTAEHRA